ncbi:MAG: hypothetical protein PVJ51_04225 [Acidobacteriota bacterium]
MALSLAATVLLLPLPALAQEEVRARDLSIIEDVLVETIQDAIQATVRAVNTENLATQERARENNEDIPLRYVFRSGSQTLARGMFLDDYGAIFTVQVPSMAYANSAFFTLGSIAAGQPGAPTSMQSMIANAGALGEELQLRAQMNRMDAEITGLRQRLEAEVARNGEDSESAQTLRASLVSWERAADETQRAYSDYVARRKREPDSRQQSVSSNRPGAAETTPEEMGVRFRPPTAAELADAEALAQKQRNQIEGAIISAVVETLGQYGRILHGLGDEDRLAVVLLPSSYLNPIGSWARATQRDQEFTISVRFRDVMDLDRGDLSSEDFGARIRIERRTGLQQQPQQDFE